MLIVALVLLVVGIVTFGIGLFSTSPAWVLVSIVVTAAAGAVLVVGRRRLSPRVRAPAGADAARADAVAPPDPASHPAGVAADSSDPDTLESPVAEEPAPPAAEAPPIAASAGGEVDGRDEESSTEHGDEEVAAGTPVEGSGAEPPVGEPAEARPDEEPAEARADEEVVAGPRDGEAVADPPDGEAVAGPPDGEPGAEPPAAEPTVAAALALATGAPDGQAGDRLFAVADQDFPIAGYEDLRVAELLPLLAHLDPDALRIVQRREAADKARATVLARIDELMAVPDEGFPISAYDSLRVVDVLPLLRSLDPDQLSVVADRERRGAARQTILGRIDELLVGRGRSRKADDPTDLPELFSGDEAAARSVVP